MAAPAAVTRTEHAVVGEVYAAGDDGYYALGRITGIAHHWTVADGQASDPVWHLRHDDEYMRTRADRRIHGRALTIKCDREPAGASPSSPQQIVQQRLLTLQQLRLRLSHGKPTNTVDFGKLPNLADSLGHSSGPIAATTS